MKLEDVTAEIRPRGRWESIDLGCALVRKNYGAIMGAWCLTVIPLWTVIALVAVWFYSVESLRPVPGITSWFYDMFWRSWVFFLIWWLKPIYDRVPLYVVSRSLFGEKPTKWQVLKEWPKMLTKDLFKLLVMRRISASRSLAMPISELERLKGTQYKNRFLLLSRNGGDGAANLTMTSSLLELCLIASCVLFIAMTFVYQLNLDGLWELVVEKVMVDSSGLAIVMIGFFSVFYAISIMIIEPFYVGAGFALYVNSRTVTEGWDIELAFKRMSERLRKLRGKGVSLLTPVIALFFMFAASPKAEASDKSSEKAKIESVMEDEDFKVHVRKDRVPKRDEKADSSKLDYSEPSGVGSGIVALGNVLFWGILITAIVLLVVWLVKNWHQITGRKGTREVEEAEAAAAKTVMGMDVTPESLPKDLVTKAREAWMAGDHHLALSLLYRGSLEWMVNKARLPIAESDTEHDCVRHASHIGNLQIEGYFSQLTSTWVNLAYGKLTPADQAMEQLCSNWPFNARAAVTPPAEGGQV